MSTRVPETPEHAALRAGVAAIEKSLLSIRSDQCDPSELRKFSIDVLPMPLSATGLPLAKAHFFRPFEKPIQDPDLAAEVEYPNYTVSDWWKRCLEDEPDYGVTPIDWAQETENYFSSFVSSLLASSQPNAPPYEEHRIQTSICAYKCQLYGLEQGREWEWRAAGLGPSLPETSHRKCSMICNVNGDETRLARGELLCITRIMHRFLDARGWIDFMVVPVLILSFMGPRHGRILEAHYNGSKLIVRKSELFDFGNHNLDAMKTFARWWCSSTVGDVLDV